MGGEVRLARRAMDGPTDPARSEMDGAKGPECREMGSYGLEMGK